MLFSILKYSIINIFLLDRNDVLYKKNKLFLRKININSFLESFFFLYLYKIKQNRTFALNIQNIFCQKLKLLL